MALLKRINHLAVVVNDIEAALRFWRDGLGLEVTGVEEVPEQRATIGFLPIGDSQIELVKPTDEASGLARYLQKHGPGMHHICFEVDDIEKCLARLRGMEVALINDEPIAGPEGKLIAFVHPKSTHGVLVELYQIAG